MAVLAERLHAFHQARLNHLMQYQGWYWIDGYSLWLVIAFFFSGVAAGKDYASDDSLSLASVPFPLAVGLLAWDLIAAGRRARRRENDTDGR